MRKKSLTVEELTSLLFARLSVEKLSENRLRVRLCQAVGEELQENKPEYVALDVEFTKYISGIVARRLKRNRHTTSLLSGRDAVKFAPVMLDVIEQTRGKLDANGRKNFKEFLRAVAEGTIEMVLACVAVEGRNPYGELWRWVNTVLDLANERGVLPAELIALDGMADEVTRRMFSEEEYALFRKKFLNKFSNIDALKQQFIQPLLCLLGGEIGDEERYAMEQEFEEYVMPQLRELVDKHRGVVDSFIDEEIARIYGV